MLKVLVVEDERPISNLICLNLKKAGYDCTALYDGKSAADILVDHTFDLILLDIMLPEINGYELMEYIVLWESRLYLLQQKHHLMTECADSHQVQRIIL